MPCSCRLVTRMQMPDGTNQSSAFHVGTRQDGRHTYEIPHPTDRELRGLTESSPDS